MQAKAAETAKTEKAAAPARQQEVTTAEQAQQYSESGTTASLLRLQHTHGNRFVQRVIQTKLEVSQPGDPYEREADEVAERIMTMPAAGAQPAAQRAPIPEEEKDKQKQPAQPIPLQSSPSSPTLPVPVEEEEEKSGRAKAFRTMEQDASNGVVPHAEEAVAAASNSTGQPLPPNLQSKFEQALGVDLGAVRVHTGPQSVEANEAISARAFATGHDIHFNEGQFNPETSQGQYLLAHEVAHTVQQQASGSDVPAGAPASPGVVSLPIIQRDAGGGARAGGIPPANSEYVPEMSVKPDSANVNMGATHEEKLDILNTRQAPARTTFHWGGGLSAAKPGLDFVDLVPSHGAHAKMHVKATAPGTHNIDATIEHQVPGGPAVYTTGPQIPLTVPPPGALASHFRESASGDGDPHDSTKLVVGDKKVLRLSFAHLKGPGDNIGSATTTLGMGLNTVLRPAEQTWINDHQVDFKFEAVAVGSADLIVKMKLGEMTDEQAVVNHVEAHVEMSKRDFLDKTIESTAMIQVAQEKATAWMDSLALAYADAWENHTKALKDQADFERLVGDLILGAALAFIPGGIGGVIGKSMDSTSKMQAFLCDGIKDLQKWGFRNAAPALLGGGGGGSTLTAYPQDPFQWRALKGVRIHTEIGMAAERNRDWIHRANTSDPNFYLDFDPARVMEDALKIQGENLQTIAPVDQAATSLVFEKGFWSKWIELYAYRVAESWSKAGVSYYVDESIGKKVKNRCKTIGFDISGLVAAAEARAEAEKDRRNEARFRF